MPVDPIIVAVLVGGVHDQEVPVLLRVDEQVVDDSALFVAEDGVLGSAGCQLGDIASDHGLYKGLRIFPPDSQLAHVGEVE